MIRIYAEYRTAPALLAAIAALRARGLGRIEAYSPYPVAGLDRALGAPPSRLAIAVLAAGMGAAAGTYGLQWLLNAALYPLNVGGRPAHFPLAFVPITFEMGVLFAALTAFVAVLVGGRLVRLWDPSREVEGIESATGEQFWLEVTPQEASEVAEIEGVLRATDAVRFRRQEVA